MEQNMNDLDNDQFARQMLGRLAATMPDNPGRSAAVQRMVQRRHRRRVATRATVGLTFAAGLGIVLVDTRRSQPAPAAAATTADTAVAGTPPGKAADPCGDTHASTDGSHAASDADPRGDVGRIKLAGTITAVDGDTISIAADESFPVSAGITDITGTIANDANYIDAGQVSSTRPTIAVGDRVAVGAFLQPDGSYTIDALEAHMYGGVAGDKTDTATRDAKQEAGATVSPDQIEKAKQLHVGAGCALVTG